jgi:signal transduction histidine kinase
VRPLDNLASIKRKLGLVIVAAVVTTLVVNEVGLRWNLKPAFRGAVAAGLALAMVQVLARGMTSPLREMANAARAMAKGEHGRRVTATSRDEVGELARAFNVMAAELEEVDRLRRDLVANVSHELRTPISALQATLENLVDGVEPPDPERFRTMLKQVERLGRLVSQLLDLSRLESGAVPLQRRTFPLRELLDDAAEACRLHAPATPVSVTVDPPDLVVDADPERLHQVVANLLENAVRHSPAGATVDVAAHAVAANGRPAMVRMDVADAGPGIPDDEASRVFERFYRSDAARASADGGAGLGLAIARWIVDLHGGSIRPERREPTGCRMVVELPVVGTTNAGGEGSA